MRRYLRENVKGKTGVYHLLALIAVIIWGTTFVSTKVLLGSGLNPAEIMFYRFLIAYIVSWCYAPGFNYPKNLKDELLFVLAGISGGSLYFITENTALQITLASNVALLLGTAPILTVLLSRLLLKNEPFKRSLPWGSAIAIMGVAFVVYNGRFILKIHPIGDMLTFAAALSWAFYNIVLKWLDGKYSTLFITRKVFFYGVVTLLPMFFFTPMTTDTAILFQPKVVLNLLFLGLVASFFCFLIWNLSVKHLGTVRTSNYIYIVPLVTLVSSSLIIHETITTVAMIGAVLILGGVYVAEKGWPFAKKHKLSGPCFATLDSPTDNLPTNNNTL